MPHPGVSTSFPMQQTPFSPGGCCRGEAEPPHFWQDPAGVGPTTIWEFHCSLPSEISSSDGGQWLASVTVALTSCQTPQRGEYKKNSQSERVFHQALVGSLTSVTNGSEKMAARDLEEGLHQVTDLYVLTKRIAEPDWIYEQQDTIPHKAHGSPQFT